MAVVNVRSATQSNRGVSASPNYENLRAIKHVNAIAKEVGFFNEILNPVKIFIARLGI